MYDGYDGTDYSEWCHSSLSQKFLEKNTVTRQTRSHKKRERLSDRFLCLTTPTTKEVDDNYIAYEGPGAGYDEKIKARKMFLLFLASFCVAITAIVINKNPKSKQVFF